MPIRMIYTCTLTGVKTEVDVYHVHTLEDSLDTIATCWVSDKQYWLSIPIYTLTPVEKKSKKSLKG